MLMLGNKSLPVEALVLPHLGPDEVQTDNITMKVFGVKLGKRLDDFLLNTVVSPSLQFISENLSNQSIVLYLPRKLTYISPCTFVISTFSKLSMKHSFVFSVQHDLKQIR